ncbi:NADP-dependent oxidoreductase [uncultured Secundilactobacillus sp.]|uniref:NADP-dependent oxidoreductase n=1 Tax=uncultured Secundilactobacillus sp. TaxID=2813935 RepID=UPI0025876D16|nr:NADP-dependent oxidoreductase [uncultured Secundilactobacillus sp.]
MKSFGFNQFGGPEVFESLTRPDPELKPTQYLVQTQAVGVNPYEQAMRKGETQADRPQTFPIIPGSDVVGTIIAAGAEATELSIGDRVVGRASLHAYSDRVAIGRKAIAKLPSQISLEQAAALPTPGITAYDLLSETAMTQHDELTILGAAGVVGSILTQLAAPLFSAVTAVASDPQTIVSGPHINRFSYSDLLNNPAPQPLIINAVSGGRHQDVVRALMTETGAVISLNSVATDLIHDFPKATFISFNDAAYKQKQRALAALIQAMEQGQLTVPITATFPLTLAGVKASHTLLAQHHKPGKIVLLATN